MYARSKAESSVRKAVRKSSLSASVNSNSDNSAFFLLSSSSSGFLTCMGLSVILILLLAGRQEPLRIVLQATEPCTVLTGYVCGVYNDFVNLHRLTHISPMGSLPILSAE